MIGTLTKLESSHNNLRTNFIDGQFKVLPKIGKCFAIKGESLTPEGSFRLVETTVIKEVDTLYADQSVYYFTTENSKYKLEVK